MTGLSTGCPIFAAVDQTPRFSMPGVNRTYTTSNVSDTWLLLALGALNALFQALTAIKVYLQMQLEKETVDFYELLEDRLIALGVALIFMFVIVKTTRRFLSENMPWKRIIAIHLVFAAITSFVWYYTFAWVSMLFCKGEKCNEDKNGMVFWFLINLDKLFLLYLFTVSVTYTYFYVLRDSVHRVQRSAIENQLLQTRLQMLKSQLHPHFLFNTLNSISSLIDINTRKAQTMLADLGDLLRHVLDYKDAQVVPLREELDLLRKYVNIEKTRFSDDLDVHWDVATEALTAATPPMILQPLVENAIGHGFSRNHAHLHIYIRIFRQGDRLCLEVRDDGQGLQRAADANVFNLGTGLKNVYERLQSLYGDAFVFTVENSAPNGVRNYIEIPVQ